FFRLGTKDRDDSIHPLDNLYSGILARTFKKDDTVVMDRFRSVMAQILCAQQPLSIESLDEIRRSSGSSEKGETGLILRSMGALLDGVASHSSPIRPFHTSFRDFLTVESRSGA